MATAAQIATLATALANRYSSQILIEITNPQNTAATTVDTTRRDNAINDCDAYLQMNGITLDTANIMHTAVIIEGAFTRLQVVAGNFPVGAWDDWKRTLLDLRQVGPRNRITPTTNSNLDPTSEQFGAKPAGDITRQKGLVGRGPGGSTVQFD